MINYYKRIIIEKAITIMAESESFLTCDVIEALCNETMVAKEYREQLLYSWQRFCHNELWFNIDDASFRQERVEKLKEFLNSK